MAGEIDFEKQKLAFEDEKKEWKHRSRLLEALLVSSRYEGNFRIPRDDQFILSEVVNGTIEYIGGIAGKLDYQTFKMGSLSFTSSFDVEMHNYFVAEMEAHSNGNLCLEVENALNRLCRHFHDDSEIPSPHTPLYDYVRGIREERGFSGGLQSSSSLPYDFVIRVQREVIPSLSDPERRDVEGIAKAMEKFVDRDLEFMERRRW